MTTWPDFAAPPMYEGAHPDWEDTALPDFRKIWDVARANGYAIGLHGSMKRDCDLIAVPWVETANPIATLVDDLCRTLNARQVGGWSVKPLGRMAVNLQIDGYFKTIDLSVFAPINLFGKAPPPVNWRSDRDAIVEDDEPMIGRDYA